VHVAPARSNRLLKTSASVSWVKSHPAVLVHRLHSTQNLKKSLIENKSSIHRSRLWAWLKISMQSIIAVYIKIDWLISCPTAEGILGFLVLRQGHPRNSLCRNKIISRLFSATVASYRSHVAINLLVIGLSCLV